MSFAYEGEQNIIIFLWIKVLLEHMNFKNIVM